MSMLVISIAKTSHRYLEILLYHSHTGSLSCFYQYRTFSLQKAVLQETWCICMWKPEFYSCTHC